MPNLDTLDTLIAVVTVLLILSLIVQSIQELIKKLLKLKSKQIEESLLDLFENVFGEKKEEFLQRSRSRIMQKLSPSSNQASDPAQEIFNKVMKEFRELGRTSTASNRMLNSISKEDLLKVLGRIGPDHVLSGFTGQLDQACKELTNLKTALETVALKLDGEAGVNFAKLREASAPLLNDLQSFFKEGSFNPGLLLSDVLNLRNVKFSDLLSLLGAAQKNVASELAATPPPDPTRKKKLDEAKLGLGEITVHLTALNQKLDAALSPLRIKLAEVEKWYDTVMQSFEERYNRGMTTVAFFISLAIVIILNANIFSIYREISTQADTRAKILQMSEKAMETYKERIAKALPTATPTPEAAKLPGIEPNSASGQPPQSTPNTTPTPEGAAQPATTSAGGQPSSKTTPSPTPETIAASFKQAKIDMDKEIEVYKGFGFPSIQTEWKALPKDKWNLLWSYLYVGFGWLLMAALLSVGAPFWNDALQSLFGVKNLLRKKSDTKNTEQESGTGQQRS